MGSTVFEITGNPNNQLNIMHETEDGLLTIYKYAKNGIFLERFECGREMVEKMVDDKAIVPLN